MTTSNPLDGQDDSPSKPIVEPSSDVRRPATGEAVSRETLNENLAEARAIARSIATRGEASVDSFLAERRAEARRDQSGSGRQEA
ncbi:hypothetical protein ACTZWW_07065 [Salinarimonas sp. NSM]|uniref:hypothetical protein n=1 Tax=Salinarimonas sp. NSM TaxID=3458003 RepID=UPI0040359DD4